MEITGNKYGSRDWRKLLGTRRGTALVAAACATLAAVVLIVAAARYRDHVNATGNPATVFVASTEIQKGTSGSAIANESLFKPTSIVEKQVSAGAISDAAQLQGKIATVNILPGQQLTTSDFTSTGGLESQLSPTERAMTLGVDSSHGLIGNVSAGDHVDVYGGVSSEVGGRGRPEEVLLAANIEVLKAPSSAPSSGLGGSSQSQESDVTLNVPQSDVGTLAYAAENGKVWLVLRPANASSTTPPSAVSVQSLLTGASSGGAK